jgi:hypothetical protein
MLGNRKEVQTTSAKTLVDGSPDGHNMGKKVAGQRKLVLGYLISSSFVGSGLVGSGLLSGLLLGSGLLSFVTSESSKTREHAWMSARTLALSAESS